LKNNLPMVINRVKDSGNDLMESTGKVITGKMSLGEGTRYYGLKTEERQAALEEQKLKREETGKINNMLGDGSKTDTEVKKDLSEVVGGIQDRLKVKNKGETRVYDGGDSEVKGYTEKGNKDVGINVGMNGVNLNNGAEIWEVAVHEAAHTSGEDETWSKYRSNAARDAWENENNYSGYTTGQGVNQQNWVQNQVNRGGYSAINQGTLKSEQVQNAWFLNAENLVKNGVQTSPTGLRNHPIHGKIIKHNGVDIAGGSTIHAAADGKLEYVQSDFREKNKGYGYYVDIIHEKDGEIYKTRYAHLKSEPNLQKGDIIKEGDEIGIMGNTGGSTATHLHFEILKFNKEINKFEPIQQNKNDPAIGLPNIGKYKKLEDIPKR
jgi:murein DD-endopeptidase MepM/ murein hydrolase activator NlpD